MSAVKGFIAERNGRILFTDGRDVFAARPGDVEDVRTGFLIGRWECSVEHFRRFAAVYEVAPEEIDRGVEGVQR